ncbi:MAG: hypothetical protein JXL84_11400 [Deltaproteobacteria bacterium]|nr:hypothetical protein [Deltaproteobacteria bacterium]
MDFVQKARVRIEHWIDHSEHHLEEYSAFAEELDGAGKQRSAGHIREMMDHSVRSMECLKAALQALGSD